MQKVMLCNCYVIIHLLRWSDHTSKTGHGPSKPNRREKIAFDGYIVLKDYVGWSLKINTIKLQIRISEKFGMQNISLNRILKSRGKFGVFTYCGFFVLLHETQNWSPINSIFFCSLTGSRNCHISLFSWWRGNETSSIHTFCLWKT